MITPKWRHTSSAFYFLDMLHRLCLISGKTYLSVNEELCR
jgi:hypothetical protein